MSRSSVHARSTPPVHWGLRAVASMALVAGAWLAAPQTADASEPWLFSAEGGYLQPLTEPQRSLFEPGITGSLALQRPTVSWLLLGVRLRGGLLIDGPGPDATGRVDPDHGTLATLLGTVRIRPFPSGDDPRRGVGPWIEGAAGGGLTGDLGRGSFEVGVGWGFAAGAVDIAPAVRYVQVIDTANNLDSRDARMLVAGLEVTFFDARRQRTEPTPHKEPEGPGDRDGDGIVDRKDECPDEPEDADEYEDMDGCPDPDNDSDGILDKDDECPVQPEDADGFEDRNGCPDPDNDDDGIGDKQDECPNEAEVVNGNEDEDGCPDEGIIELVDDRIVLGERVMFNKDSAKLKASSRRVLQAIVDLWRQHPEWAKLRVEGHADVRGPEEYNKELSERRARVTMQKLIEFGIPEDIIDFRGYGSSRPRDLRRTEEAHRRNRRVEFVVVARHAEEQGEGETAEEQ